MSDVPPATAPPADPPADPPAERTVPYDRFKAVNDRLAEANRKAEEEAQKRQELEDRDKSELEQERSKREKAEARIAELQGEVEGLTGTITASQRSGWVKDAATKANFIDPADALGRVDLSSIEDEAAAKAAVKKVADDAKHLIAGEAPPPPQVGQVIRNGQPVPPSGEPDPAAAENEAFLQELKEANQRGWSTSTTGLIETP